MNKFFNYVRCGQGYGIKFIALFTLIWAVAVYALIAFYIKSTALPDIRKAADELLPIRIEDGRITSPLNTIKYMPIRFVKSEIPLVLDTTVDEINTSDLQSGIYISRTAVYTVTGKDIRISPFEGSVELTANDYKQGLEKNIFLGALAVLFCLALIFFAFTLVFTAIYALFAVMMAKIVARDLDYKSASRLSSVVFGGSLLICNFAGFFIFLPSWVILCAIAALQFIIIKKMFA
ncbi:MAG: DUF1189 family protein [Alphaproteobacteria bacterium]|nr:DUF1189 family protein [Alphaproteobacteria bacterium]